MKCFSKKNDKKSSKFPQTTNGLWLVSTLEVTFLVELFEKMVKFRATVGKGLTKVPRVFDSRFVCERVPALRAEGWIVEYDEAFEFRPADAGRWKAEVKEQGRDWFDLSLGVEVDGRRVDLLPILVAVLKDRPDLATGEGADDDERLPVRLDDGRILPIRCAGCARCSACSTSCSTTALRVRARARAACRGLDRRVRRGLRVPPRRCRPLQALAAQFQQAVQRGVQRSLVARVQITQARAVDGCRGGRCVPGTRRCARAHDRAGAERTRGPSRW